MNIYECFMERDIIIGYGQNYPVYAPNNAYELIAAPTRGKAKYMFIKQVNDEGWIEWTSPMSIKFMVKNVDAEAGIVDSNHPALDEYWQDYLEEQVIGND